MKSIFSSKRKSTNVPQTAFEIVHLKFPIDHGWAWMVLLACVILQFIGIGYLKSCGTLFSHLRTEVFYSNKETMTIAMGLVYPVACISMIFTNILDGVLTSRVCLFIGGFLCAGAQVGCYFISEIWQMAILFDLILGIGVAFSFGSSTLAVSRYFDKRKTLAAGLSTAGGSIGQIVFPYLIDLFLVNFGWRGCYLIVGGILLHLWIAAMLFRDKSYYSFKRQKIIDIRAVDMGDDCLTSEVGKPISNGDVNRNNGDTFNNATAMVTLSTAANHDDDDGNNLLELVDESSKFHPKHSKRIFDDNSKIWCDEQELVFISHSYEDLNSSSKRNNCSRKNMILSEDSCDDFFNRKIHCNHGHKNTFNRHSWLPLTNDNKNYSLDIDDEIFLSSKLYNNLYSSMANLSMDILTTHRTTASPDRDSNNNADLNKDDPLVSERETTQSFKSKLMEAISIMNLRPMFRDIAFYLMVLSYGIYGFAYSVYFLMNVDYARQLKMTADSYLMLLPLYAISDGAGRILTGIMATHSGIPNCYIYQASIFSMGIINGIILVSARGSHLSLFLLMAVTGFCCGSHSTVLWPVLVDEWGKERLPVTFAAVHLLHGICAVVGPLILAVVVDITGDYFWTFMLAAGIYVLDGLILILVVIILRRRRKVESLLQSSHHLSD